MTNAGPSDANLLDYYARRAVEYERVYAKPERQADLGAIRTRLREWFAGHDVLELACGTGYWTEVIAPVARSVLATDLSAEVMEIARHKVYPPGRVAFAAADAYALDAVPGDFTAAFAGFWWSHIPRERLAGFLAGLHRRLGPGRRVVFIDNRYVPGSSTPLSDRDARGNTYQARRLADGSAFRVLKNFPDESELRAAVAGATDVSIEMLPYYWCLCYTTE